MVQIDLREIALLDRRGTNSAKWDSLLATFGQEDLLPLWVADMDFKAPKCVRDALHQAVEQIDPDGIERIFATPFGVIFFSAQSASNIL